jgi:DNA polymerase elongation subunit (family B)
MHCFQQENQCEFGGFQGAAACRLQVIYAQTDSVFIHFPSATAAEAVTLGQQAAQLVTAQLPAPIELKYERVMCPFMLLHVNRCVYWVP